MWKIILVFLIPLCFGNPPEKCSHPTTPYTCSSILDYLHCLGPSVHVQDCKQTDQYIYWRVDNPMSWSGALVACEGVDKGSLVSIHNFEETNIVNELKEAKIVTNTYVWIGLNCPGTCNSLNDFVWSDGTPLDYSKFYYPNDASQYKCGIVYKYKNVPINNDYGDLTSWNNQNCSNPYISICKVAIK